MSSTLRFALQIAGYTVALAASSADAKVWFAFAYALLLAEALTHAAGRRRSPEAARDE